MNECMNEMKATEDIRVLELSKANPGGQGPPAPPSDILGFHRFTHVCQQKIKPAIVLNIWRIVAMILSLSVASQSAPC